MMATVRMIHCEAGASTRENPMIRERALKVVLAGRGIAF